MNNQHFWFRAGIFALLMMSVNGLSGQCSTADWGTLTYSPDFGNSLYPAGTVVTVCLTTDTYTPDDAEYLHSIIPLGAGPGFDFSTITPGPPPPEACGNGGNWAWYPSWTRCAPSCQTVWPGRGLPGGFAFDSPSGTMDFTNCNSPAVLDGDPGNNWGDGNATPPCNAAGLTFCFDLTTVDATGQCPGAAYRIDIEINPDGETGSYNGISDPNECTSPCQDDPTLCFPEVEDPRAEQLNNPCPGENFVLQGSFANNLCNPSLRWVNSSGTTVSTDPVFMTNVEDTYTLFISNDFGCREVMAMVTTQYPTINPSISPDPGDSFCFGETVTLSASGGNAYQWRNPLGTVVSNGPTYSFIGTPAVAGTYTVEVFYGTGNACSETLTTDITVAPEILASITNTGPACFGSTLSFVITDDVGNPFPAGTTYTWNGVADGSFHMITAAGSGVQTMTVEVALPNGCTNTFTNSFEVWDLPMVTIDPSDPTICFDGSVDLTIVASGGRPPYSYQLGPDNAPGPVVTIDRNSPTTSNLYGDVTDANGCRGFSSFVSLLILPDLVAPDISCTESLDEITFDWNDVGQDYFELYVRVGAGVEQLVDNRYRNLSYTETGLGQGVSVTIRMIPVIFENGETCIGEEATLTCRTPACPDPGWMIGAIDTICLATGGLSYDLDISTTDAGTIVMNSTSLGLSGAPINTAGATSIPIPPLMGDTTALVHQLNLSYTSQDGSCTVDSLITLPVVRPANPAFTGADLSLCNTDTTVIFSLVEAYDTNTVYLIDVENPSGTTIIREEPTNGEWEIEFTEFRTHQVRLITESMSNTACRDTFTVPFTLQAPPIAPTVSCASTGLDSVVFVWNDVGADSYTVNEIDLPTGATTERTPTGFIVRNLNTEDMVTISVTAVTAGCASATSAETTCTASACPPVTPMITTPVDTFCLDGTTSPVALTVTAPNTGTVTWSGPGVSGTNFDPVVAGEGVHDIVATYTEDVCDYTDTLELVVISPPAVSLLADRDSICVGDTIMLRSPESYAPGEFTFDWQLPAGTTIISGDVTGPGPLDVRFDAAGDFAVTLVVGNRFCTDQSATTNITVVAPLGLPTVECDNLNFDQVGFVWSHPTATMFDVSIDAQPPGAVITQNGNSLLATGLAEGESVTITVRALATNICGDSEPVTLTCTAQTCPAISLIVDPQGPFCASGIDENVPLTATVTGSNGSGILSWQGPGVVGDAFFVDTAGVGIHEIIGVFQEEGCTFRDTIMVTVNALPVPSLNLPAGPICVDDVITVDAGAPQPGFSYNFLSPGATLGAAPDAASQEFSWPTAGRRYVLLTVTDDNGCQSLEVTDSIDVVARLQRPMVECGITSLTSVEFTWETEPGVDSFQIVVDGQPPFFQDSTTLTISGLGDGVDVEIEVIALGSGPCGNSEPGMATCSSDPCPAITVTPPTDEDFCANTAGNETVLTATQTGGSGGGVFTFSGPGVFLDNGDWRFHADTAGLGSHQIRVVYTESICSDTAFFTYRVFDPPTADFTMNGMAQDLTVCAGSVFEVAYAGNVLDGESATFNWDFDVASSTPLGAFETYELSFASAGTYSISLSVDRQGCSSEEVSFEVTVVDPLGAPLVSCGTSTLNSTQFTWTAIPGATSYEVTVGGVVDTTTNLDYVVTGLLPGEGATLTVRALGGTVCGDGPASAPLECFAAPCPDLVPDFSALPDQLCLENGDEFILLSDFVVSGGSGINGSYTFSGPGVRQDTFFAALAMASEAGEVNQINIQYAEEGPCTLDTIFEVTVFDRPSVFITDPGPQCVGDTLRVLIGSTNFVANDDINVDWDGGILVDDGDADDNEYLLYYDTPGTKTILATVLSNISGCMSDTAFMIVEVSEPLRAPVMGCGPIELETITFIWDPVPGSTGYEVVPANGDPTVVTTDTFFVVNNRTPETTFSVTVRALGDGPCGDSEPTPFTCETAPCPGGRAQAVTADTDICLDGTEVAFLLEANLTEGMPTGPFTWSGTGVVDNGDGTFSFNPVGLSAGEYLSVVSYLGRGNCTSTDTVRTNLFDLPVVGFNTTPATVCVGESFNVLFNGSAEPGAEFVWDFDGADITSIGQESYLVSWDTPGMKTINLLVTDNCPAAGSVVVEVLAPLATPEPNCTRQDLDGVLFSWSAIPGATEGYRISINDGPFGPITTSTDTLISGLDFGESVSISVLAVRTGTPCDESMASTPVSCAARECPPISLAPAAPQTTFCANEQTAVLLEANLSGDDGSGTLSWTGAGVVPNGDGSFSFDPAAAGIGTHALYVDYVQEVLCTYRDSLVMTVNAVPVASFTTNGAALCVNTDLTVQLEGAVDAQANYTWDFDGAQSTDLGEESYLLAWPVAGTYTIRLTVDRLGCSAVDSMTVTVEASPNSGNSVADDLQFCVSETTPLDLSAQLVNQDPGGNWSVVAGSVPNGSLNATSGMLDLSNLGAGNYRFAYTVDGTNCAPASTEVAVELLAAPRADAGEDQILTCNMGMVSLNGSGSETGAGYTFRWTADDASVNIMDADQLMIDVGQPATYQLEVTNAIGCSATDEVVVTAEREAPVLELELSQITCFQADDGAINVTNVTGGRAPYTFSLNGEDRGRNTLMAGLQPDQYEVRVTDANGCFSDVLIDLTQPDELSIRLIFPGDSSIVDEGEEVFISASVVGGNAIDTLIWQPDSIKNRDGLSGIEFVATETRMISVTVVDELGCTATDRQMLLVRQNRPVYFPTAFSPNGDNNNDIFFIGANRDQVVEIRDFFIFDRWGEAVFTAGTGNGDGGIAGARGFPPNDPNFGWDGTLNGEPMNPQVFVYTAVVVFADGTEQVFKGDFVLMR
ncbi:gliding motility-associated C-terminal domain-containing protein [Lewinella sp. W8]|uniref:T9SS type B sorting domain-containing protein n=1 Tax=Lewinella sp. W8 TaxID=2528208 RepID=UPI001068B813|nr:gliding motility-associated C-terminal domain-containing protein [Lewinella sp. W8]MTB53277.1 hypothetical protein [Lewinella sp. W8]